MHPDDRATLRIGLLAVLALLWLIYMLLPVSREAVIAVVALWLLFSGWLLTKER